MSLVDTFTEAQRIYLKMRQEGQSFDEASRYLAGVLRVMLPWARPWMYGCAVCSDAGLEIRWCGGLDRPTCGRTFPHDGHEYGRPCTCERGLRFLPKPTADGDVADAGKRGRRTLTRFGSR